MHSRGRRHLPPTPGPITARGPCSLKGALNDALMSPAGALSSKAGGMLVQELGCSELRGSPFLPALRPGVLGAWAVVTAGWWLPVAAAGLGIRAGTFTLTAALRAFGTQEGLRF